MILGLQADFCARPGTAATEGQRREGSRRSLGFGLSLGSSPDGGAHWLGMQSSMSGCLSSPECQSVVCEPLWPAPNSIRDQKSPRVALPLSANTAHEAAEMRIVGL